MVCQFGVMFFPDRVAAYREALRVLKPGGRFLFNVWDRIESNPVTARRRRGAVAALFPDDPPSFYRRVPFGYHDKARIEADLRAAGFTDDRGGDGGADQPRRPPATPPTASSRARRSAPRSRRRRRRLDEATSTAAAALAPFDGKDAPMSAHVISAGG